MAYLPYKSPMMENDYGYTFAADSEVDGYQMLVNIQDASRLMLYPLGNITAWRLWLEQPLQVDTLSQQTLPQGTKWQDWRDQKPIASSLCLRESC